MATPTYLGNGQPQAGKSMWSGLTSWFGRSSPAYKPAASTTNANSSTSGDANAPSSGQPTRVIIIVPHGGFIPGIEWPDAQQ
jgi:hypothetical protein